GNRITKFRNYEFLRFIQRVSALFADTHFAVAVNFVADANRAARRSHELHVRERNAALLLGNSALNVTLRIRTHVLLHHHDVLDQHLALGRKHAEHASFLALVAAGDHLHGVVPLDVDSLLTSYCCRCCHLSNLLDPLTCLPGCSRLHLYRTSGANETIFKNFLSRSSRATGPNTRVPTGSPVSLMSTAAFWSKRM